MKPWPRRAQSIRKLKRRTAHRAHRRHRLRRADASRPFCRMDEVDRVLGNDDKLRAPRGTMPTRHSTAVRCHAGSKDRRVRQHGGDGAWCRIWSRAIRAAFRAPSCRCERLRSPLHVLHHPLRPRQFALGGDGRWSIRPRADRGGHAEIVLTGVDLTSFGGDRPGTPKLGTLVKQIQACA